jgi:hypothetical protein
MGLTGQEERGGYVDVRRFRVKIGIVVVVHWGRSVASCKLWGIIHYRVINKGYALLWYWCIHWGGGLDAKRQSTAEHLLKLLDLGRKSLILVFHLGRLLHLLCECKSAGLVCKGKLLCVDRAVCGVYSGAGEICTLGLGAGVQVGSKVHVRVVQGRGE